jgi:hypothetical protein
MDPFLSLTILVVADRHGICGSLELHSWESAMTTLMHHSLAAIACQLHAAYLPILEKPLPNAVKDLLAQLVALEREKR